jgi:hypothetical protein
MRRVAETGRIASLRGMRLGRLMPMVRGRAVGHETSAAVDSPDGGLQISVETEMAFSEVGLRQSVVATYDEMLRPERVMPSSGSAAMPVTKRERFPFAAGRCC